MIVIQEIGENGNGLSPLFPDTKEKNEILILPLNLKATHGKHLCNSVGAVVRMNFK